MKTTIAFAAAVCTASLAFAQNVTIPATNGALPAGGANGCAAGYYPGSDTVLYTVPYTYQQVLSKQHRCTTTQNSSY